MSFLQDFKEFAARGNVIDMAVGVIIGGAFGKITASLVNDVIMPPIGILIGGVNFKDLAITIKAAAGDIPAVTIKYGLFINTVLEFLIIAFAVFLMVKGINALKRKEEERPVPSPEPPPKEELLLTEIRDLLKNKA
jgi:large conductance mechanosensitive channel